MLVYNTKRTKKVLEKESHLRRLEMKDFLITQFWITVIVVAEVMKWVAASYLFRSWGPVLMKWFGIGK
jgi:hypothetical protein